jgi:uncharacterized protein YegP (UPF0339 family)
MKRPKFEIRRGNPEPGVIPTFYWVLVAANGEVLATSETFPDKATCKKSIRAARVAALGRVIER